MKEIVVFTNIEFFVIVCFILLLGIISIISSVGWFVSANKNKRRRDEIKDMFPIEYRLALWGGKENYSDYIIEVENNIKKQEQKKRKFEYGKENLYCNCRRIF